MPADDQGTSVISYRGATAIVAGCIIGSGIFMKPATMAAQVGSPVWLAVVWLIAGLFSLCGALIYAELGAMFPKTGGLYVYFREMYGDFPAFLYGWSGFAVINSASVAAIAFVCADYSNYFLHIPDLPPEVAGAWELPLPFLGKLYPLQHAGVKLIAVVLVLGLTWLNYLSVKAGSALQVISTVIKIAALGMLVAGILLSGKGAAVNFIQPGAMEKHGLALVSGIISALTGAFMAYDGWINVTFMAGELQSPRKDIPRSLTTGLLLSMVVYLLVTAAYLYVLPVDTMAKSPLVAEQAMYAALGNVSSTILAAMVVICTFGAVNGNTMAIARVTYAMGNDRLFFPWTGKDHPRYRTPGNALWLHGGWAVILVISGSFDMLADMFTFVAWVFYLLGGIGFFILRRRMPDYPRPYKTWGYPLLPLLFIVFSLFYVISTVWNDVSAFRSGRTPVINSLLGLAITALGLPLYFYFSRKNKKAG
ncbi:amino acid permease [Chitinophaga sp. Mgbs1]|uniref:Amino acid permease n=1 Tax=Chitinophaga solisilvae TaxID=1233460 RepID=A0A3S1CYU0_9BACT|nr:amino acid permease [Chitinophaga solisilvae]